MGLPIVTKSPAERSKRYTAVVAIFAAALIVLTLFAQNALFQPAGGVNAYGAVTSARHAAGNSASVSGGFGGSVGGAGWMTASENQ